MDINLAALAGRGLTCVGTPSGRTQCPWHAPQAPGSSPAGSPANTTWSPTQHRHWPVTEPMPGQFPRSGSRRWIQGRSSQGSRTIRRMDRSIPREDSYKGRASPSGSAAGTSTNRMSPRASPHCPMLGQRQRQWANIETALGECLLSGFTMFLRRWINVFQVDSNSVVYRWMISGFTYDSGPTSSQCCTNIMLIDEWWSWMA